MVKKKKREAKNRNTHKRAGWHCEAKVGGNEEVDISVYRVRDEIKIK